MDPACVLTTVKDEAMRDVTKRISMAIELEPNDVIAGSMAVLRVVITNTAATDTLLVFDALPKLPGPRPDWSRLAGVPDVKGEHPEAAHVQLVLSTTDQWHRSVDAVPTVSSASAAGAQPVPRLLGVRLKPGAKVTCTDSWWAVRIPAPAPIFKDDAGHRWVPKTTAFPLLPGDYTIAADVPFHALAPAERTVTMVVHVVRAPKRDE